MKRVVKILSIMLLALCLCLTSTTAYASQEAIDKMKQEKEHTQNEKDGLQKKKDEAAGVKKELENVSKDYQDGQHALKNVSLEVKKGEFVFDKAPLKGNFAQFRKGICCRKRRIASASQRCCKTQEKHRNSISGFQITAGQNCI